MAMTEICVRGAGIFGLSIAWACAKKGARVQVVDPYGPGAGSSGGLVGALAPHVPENWNPKKQFQLESLLLAEPFWNDVTSTGGVDAGYARTGRVQPLADESAVALALDRSAGAEHLWNGAAIWRVTDAPGPFAPQSATGWYVQDTLSARIHPSQACAALVAALEVMRVPILAEAPEQTADATIWATGVAGLEALNAGRARAIGTGIKGQAAALRFTARDAAQIFADGLHIVPHADGTVAVGSTTEQTYTSPDTTDHRLDEIVEQARAAVPVLHGAPVVARWAGLRPRTRSRAPMLGAWPDRPGNFIANGGFKIGFGMAPKVAQVMASLVLDGIDEIPQDFRPEASF